MTSYIIPSLVVLGVVAFALKEIRARRTSSWMPADAHAQLQRESRYPVRIPFAAAVTIRNFGSEQTIPAQSEDLAVGGMLLKPSSPLSIGQPIHVSFSLPAGPSIDIPAVVCRTVGKSFGIRFDFADKERAQIAEWVEQNCKAAAH